MTTAVQLHELVREDRVHRSVYTDPQIFAAEMQRIFARTWLFVAHESEVPSPGDYKTDTIAGRPVIVVRGDDGAVRVLYNACRHRGSLVCYEADGHSARFRCLYHGWTYSNVGRLVAVPLRDRFENLDMNELGLVEVPRVASYRGFVFASLAPQGPSLESHLGQGAHYIDQMCDRAPDGEIEAVRPIKYEYAGNWKLQVENYPDNYHPIHLHKSAFEMGVKAAPEKYGSSESALLRPTEHHERSYGAGHGMADYGATRGVLWMNAYENPEYMRLLEQKHAPEEAERLRDLDLHVTIYPNLLLHTRQNHFRVVKPMEVGRTEVWAYPCKLKGAPEDTNDALVMNTSQHTSAMGEVQVDDLQAFTWVQQGLGVPEMEWILFKLHGQDEHLNPDGQMEWSGPSEEIMRHQYREWARLMGSRIPIVPLGLAAGAVELAGSTSD